MKSKSYLLPAAIIGFALLIFYWLQWTAPEVNSHSFERVPVSVITMPVSLEPTVLQVRSQGTVQPRTETPLIAQVAGEITWVAPFLKSGGRFKQGDRLLTIDPADHQLKLAQANADLKRADAEHALALAELKRVQSLHDRGLASDAQKQQAQRNVDVAEAAKIAAEVAINRASLDLERTVITAPYTGRVRSATADLGQFIQRGGNLGVLYATDRVEIRLPLPDAQLAYLNPALLAAGVIPEGSAPEVMVSAVYAGAQRQWRGQIIRTEGEIDQASRMVHAVAEVANEPADNLPELPVGLFVKATIEGVTVENVATIPRSALVAGNQVLLVDSNNRLVFRHVELLRLDDNNALVIGGLSDGERLCLTRLQAPVEGMEVNPKPVSQ